MIGVTGRVPLARRALFSDRRRAALAAGGVAAALLLVLLLQGIFDGAMRQTTAYLRGLPADVIVSQKGVRTMHMSVSALDPGTPAAVARVDGVAWAEGIRYTTTFLVAPGGSPRRCRPIRRRPGPASPARRHPWSRTWAPT
jgi:putative ABC transport system permease protein